MKVVLFIGLVLILVPIQSTFFHYVSIVGVRPDLCLVVACVVGFLSGRTHGLIVGFGLGFVQDLFSAGDLWMNTLTKPLVGFLSGLAARNLVNIAPQSIFVPALILSMVSGLILLVSVRTGANVSEILGGIQSTLLPQAFFDGVVAMGVNWSIAWWMPKESVL